MILSIRTLRYKVYGPHELSFTVFQVLLAFGKDDFQSDAFWLACEKLGYECSLARNKGNVLDAFETKHHEIIIIDTRNPKVFDGESICR
jgi:high affinity cAMP-specific and IBMX-insensitive 3',5'-cyclic phosphodiesterase 8